MDKERTSDTLNTASVEGEIPKLSDYDDPIDWSFWGKVAFCAFNIFGIVVGTVGVLYAM